MVTLDDMAALLADDETDDWFEQYLERGDLLAADLAVSPDVPEPNLNNVRVVA